MSGGFIIAVPNIIVPQIRLIWAEGVQPPNQIYSSCTTRSPHAKITQFKAGGLRVQLGRTTARSEMSICSLIQFVRAFTCPLLSSSAQCRGVRGEYTELNVIQLTNTHGFYSFIASLEQKSYPIVFLF